MADRLQLIIDALDNSQRILTGISDKLGDVAEVGEKSNEKIADASENTLFTLAKINQALELSQKAWNLLSGALSFPIKQFEALTSLGIRIVEVYDQQFRAVTSLSSAMKAQGVFTEELIKDFEDYAAELQGVIAIGDEVILQQQAVLGAFTGFGQGLKDATVAAADLAAGFGIPFESAMRKFVKAVQLGSFELAEGVTFQLQATDAAERLAEAVEVVNSRFAGTAEAVASSGLGPITKAFDALKDVVEDIGKAISETPEVQGFIAGIVDFAKSLRDAFADNRLEVIQAIGTTFQTSFNVAKASVQALTKLIVGFASVIDKIPGVDILPRGLEDIGDSIIAQQGLINRLQEQGRTQVIGDARARIAARRAQAKAIEEARERLEELNAELDEASRNPFTVLNVEATKLADVLDDEVAGALEGIKQKIREAQEEFARTELSGQQFAESILRGQSQGEGGGADLTFGGGRLENQPAITSETIEGLAVPMIESGEHFRARVDEATDKSAEASGKIIEAAEQGLDLQGRAADQMEGAATHHEAAAESLDGAAFQLDQVASAFEDIPARLGEAASSLELAGANLQQIQQGGGSVVIEEINMTLAGGSAEEFIDQLERRLAERLAQRGRLGV